MMGNEDAVRSRRTMVILAVSQGLCLSAMSIDLTVTALAGSMLAPSAALSTLPMAMISLGSVVVAPLISRLMARIGTKATLLSGAAVAVVGGVLSWLAMTRRIFVLLCLGTLAVGVYQAVANYYRYIAADCRPGKEKESVALVLSAGVVAAIVGPIIATSTSHLLEPLYAGSYVAVSVLGAAALCTLALLPIGRDALGEGRNGAGESAKVSVSAVLRRPRFIAGALLSAVACFAMTVVMSGVPLELEYGLHASESSRMVAMQLHMIGMYGPMLVLPLLASRLGHLSQALMGIILGLLGVVAGSMASVPSLTAMLLLVGVAWSVAYATGSALLTTSYTARERRVARGVGEFFPVFGLVSGSLLAGPIITWAGWQWLVGICGVALALAALVCCGLRASLK